MRRTDTKAIEHKAPQKTEFTTAVDALQSASLRPDRPCVGRALTERLVRKNAVALLACHRWPCASGAMTEQLVRESLTKTAPPSPPQSGGEGGAGVGWPVPGSASRESCFRRHKVDGEQQRKNGVSAKIPSRVDCLKETPNNTSPSPFRFHHRIALTLAGRCDGKRGRGGPFCRARAACGAMSRTELFHQS